MTKCAVITGHVANNWEAYSAPTRSLGLEKLATLRHQLETQLEI